MRWKVLLPVLNETLDSQALVNNARVKKALSAVAMLAMGASLVGCVAPKQTGYLEIGNRLDFRQLVSQHGMPFGDISKVRLVVYADSMTGSKMVHRVFAEYSPACFDAGTVVFVGDVSGMPSMVTRLAAVPLMQSYSYPVWLDYDGAATANLPVLANQVSLLTIEDGRMEGVGYAHTDEGISNALLKYCVRQSGKTETASAP